MALRYGFGLALAGLCSAYVFACGPETGTGKDGSGSKNGKGGNSGSDADGGVGNGNGEGGEGPGPLNPVLRPEGGGPLTPDSSCGASALEPEAVVVEETIEEEITCTAQNPEPIAIYIVLDNSGSMDDNDKWTDAVTALTEFVQSDPTLTGSAWTCVDKNGVGVPAPATLPPPGSGSVSVAIQYFHPEGVNNANECDGSGHRVPDVPMGPIPANGGAIVNSLSNTGPSGDTPTGGSLLGGVQYCQAYQASNPTIRCVNVLVTDGQPNGCGLSSDCPGSGNDCVDPNSSATLTPIATSGFTNPTNSVMTFTVGMAGITPEGFVLLDAIAVAGGSDCTPGSPGGEACNITTGGAQGFIDALNTIRETVQETVPSTQSVTTSSTVRTTLPCEWTIPDMEAGKVFDKNLVNITYSTVKDGPEEKLGNVPTQADCAAAGAGWYYDTANPPTKIFACPDTCTLLQDSTESSVQLLFGCVTEPAKMQ